jgi:hypothetical protein
MSALGFAVEEPQQKGQSSSVADGRGNSSACLLVIPGLLSFKVQLVHLSHHIWPLQLGERRY